MSYAVEMQEFETRTHAMSTDRPQLPSGFGENAIASIGQIMDENLSISEWIVRESGGFSYSDRDDDLKALRKSGDISDDLWISFTEPAGHAGFPVTNYSGLAKYLNKERNLKIPSNEEIDADMRQTLKDRREYAESVFARQTGMGAFGEIAGGFVGYGIEPANVIGIVGESLLLTRSAFALSEATTRLGRAVITGKQALIAGVASETLIQPILFNWHEEIGVDMGWGDALANIASVGVLSGVLGAGAGALIKGRGAQIVTAEDLVQVLRGLSKEAENLGESSQVQAVLKRVQEEVESLPPDTPIKEHMEKVDSTQQKINEERIQSEPEEVINQGVEISDVDLEKEIQAMIAEGKEPMAMFRGSAGDFDFGKLTEYEMRIQEKQEILKSCIGG